MDLNVKDPRFLRWTGAVLVVMVVVPMYFMSASYPFTHASRREVVKELESKHLKLSQDLQKARLLVSNLARVEQEYAILHEQWQVAQTLLPDQNQMPDLLRKVTAAGQQSGVEFTLFRPQTPLPQGFYADNPVEVTVEGGYHQTGVFLSRLANLNRIVNVSQLKMKGLENQQDTPFTVKSSMILTAYTLGPANPAPAPENEGKGDGTLASAGTTPQGAQPSSAAGAKQ